MIETTAQVVNVAYGFHSEKYFMHHEQKWAQE